MGFSAGSFAGLSGRNNLGLEGPLRVGLAAVAACFLLTACTSSPTVDPPHAPAVAAIPQFSTAARAIVAYAEGDNSLRWLDGEGKPTLSGGAPSVALSAVPVDVVACDKIVYLAFPGGEVAAVSSVTGRQIARSRVSALALPGARDLLVDGMGCADDAVYVYGSFNLPPSDLFETFVEILRPETLEVMRSKRLPGVVQDADLDGRDKRFLLDDGRLYDPEADQDLGLAFPGAENAQEISALDGEAPWFAVGVGGGFVVRVPGGRSFAMAEAGLTDLVAVPGGGALVVSRGSSSVRLVEADGTTRWSSKIVGGPYVATVGPSKVLVGAVASDAVVVLDLDTGKAITNSQVADGIVRIAYLRSRH